ncbi:NAD(P)/FAD-dependent oxidoreductase [Nitrospira defluvii]|nr:NAD(P)/FAD-dependent oxidoreductase [Nitrospira defluvii]
MMCALTAGQRSRRILLLERSEKVGKKILVSGGGRCNFTNRIVEAHHFLSENPHFCKSALSRFSQHDFIGLVEKHGVAYTEKTLGQLFCKQSSQAIVDLLLAECRKGDVKIVTNCSVEKIDKTGRFQVVTSQGDYEADALVIATGGLSLPKIGATDFGYRVAKQFGLNIIPCHPALVALTLGEQDRKNIAGLSGISVDAEVSCKGQSFREAILFTHKGLSGPAILQISNYWKPKETIVINLLPDRDLSEIIQQWQHERPRAELKTLISTHLPKRLAVRWLALAHKNKAVNQYTHKEIDAVVDRFHRWHIVPSGTSGFRSAEVTAGGIDTKALSSKTLETKAVSGLYFIGEVLDITGWLGGYNFQWAWSSGWCAGQYV